MDRERTKILKESLGRFFDQCITMDDRLEELLKETIEMRDRLNSLEKEIEKLKRNVEYHMAKT